MNDDGSGNSEVRELRLALVCYGGVSLAVYMHGMTKELLKLVRASRAYDHDPTAIPEGTTERAYFAALDDLAKNGTRVRVVIDVISGTSAGGINGVCLATALARDGDDKALKETWFAKGDIGGLINAPNIGLLQLRVATVAMRLVTTFKSYTPLKGKDMSKWLFTALSDIATSRASTGPGYSGLVPGDSSLHLRVTTTDLNGYDRLVAMGTGDPPVGDKNFRHVFEFDHEPGAEPGASNFETDHDIAALALACRCTSSIPGAFPAVRLHDFAGDIEREGSLTHITGTYFPSYANAALSALDTEFVDGGVLDNAPFDQALALIADQRAQTEVARHLVYLEPDPGLVAKSGDGKTKKKSEPAAPGWLKTAWTAASKIQRHEPLLQQLVLLRQLNERIARIGALGDEQTETVQKIVDASLEEIGAAGSALDTLDYAQVDRLGASLHAAAMAHAGLTYPTYVRLKLQESMKALATEIARAQRYHRDSSPAGFVRVVMGAWLRAQDAFGKPTVGGAATTLLGSLDIGYRDRRLRFVLQGVNQLYGAKDGPPRASIDGLKRELWDRLDRLNRAGIDAAAAVAAEAAARFGASLDDDTDSDPAMFARTNVNALSSLVTHYGTALTAAIAETNKDLWKRFLELTESWKPETRQVIAVRYLAFPIWDQLLFPIVALSETPQFSPIRVTRFSPDRATLLKARDIPAKKVRGVPGKLRGTGFHHFAAFFHRDWRENDYLWGRLDAAELIMKLLHGLDERDPRPDFDPKLTRDALSAVLRDEADLASTKELRADLAAQLRDLTPTPAAP